MYNGPHPEVYEIFDIIHEVSIIFKDTICVDTTIGCSHCKLYGLVHHDCKSYRIGYYKVKDYLQENHLNPELFL